MKNASLKLTNYFDKINIIICMVLSMFITILQMLGRFLDVRYKGLNISIVRIGLEGVLFFVLCNMVLVLLWKGGQKMLHSKPLTKPVFSKLWFWQLIILISWLPCYLAYFPGIYSYDGEPQLIQYTSGQLDNHHPIVHTYIIGGCYDLGQWLQSKGIGIDGLAFYTTIQCLLLSFAFAFVLRFLVNRNAGSVYIMVSAIYICFFPTVPLMAMSSTKDTFFTAFFIMFLAELAELFIIQEDISKRVMIRLFVFALGCMFFRRNGYYVILILLLCCGIATIVHIVKNKYYSVANIKSLLKNNPLYQVTLILLVSVIVFSSSERIIINCSDALEGESAEALSIPLQQMARAYKSSDAEVRAKYGDRLSEYISETGLSNYRLL